jgi:glyoxylase-like metal-dependent hydrolase (beta-lactamase superfamily II)
VSLWRTTDRTLIAGDAFVTTAQESVYSVMTQREELHGPPQYFTTDWPAAKNSVRKLAELNPEIVVTGHGHALRGEKMRAALELLARDFDRVAVPPKGRYVAESARADESGVTYIPPDL